MVGVFVARVRRGAHPVRVPWPGNCAADGPTYSLVLVELESTISYSRNREGAVGADRVPLVVLLRLEGFTVPVR